MLERALEIIPETIIVAVGGTRGGAHGLGLVAQNHTTLDVPPLHALDRRILQGTDVDRSARTSIGGVAVLQIVMKDEVDSVASAIPGHRLIRRNGRRHRNGVLYAASMLLITVVEAAGEAYQLLAVSV